MPCRQCRSELVDEIARLRGELRGSRREVQHLRVEDEILRDAAEPLIHHAPAGERFVFIHARRERFGVRRLCRVLVTEHSNYHAWVRARKVRDRRGYDGALADNLILAVHSPRPGLVQRCERQRSAKRPGPWSAACHDDRSCFCGWPISAWRTPSRCCGCRR